jgi:hypothetical protein
MRVVLWIVLALVAAPAHALRCGNRVIVEGDHAVQVLDRCGEPYWVEVRPEWLIAGEDGPLEQRIERRVEAWYYNFGTQKLLRRLVFIDDRLQREETLGYGYSGIGRDCDLDALVSGLSTGEVVARCGLPARKSARYSEVTERAGSGLARQRLVRLDDWVYDPGRGRNLRLLKFVDGDLERIETLSK